MKRKLGTNNIQQAARRDAAALVALARATELASPVPASVPEPTTQPAKKKQKQMHTTPHEEALKRSTIQFFFEQLGCPAEALWEGVGGAIIFICDRMQLPLGQKHIRTIRRTLMKQHVAITCELPLDDPNRFKLGTPAELSDTMERTWEVCPPPGRIVQDISHFPVALDAIIAARGAKVPELDNRRGRRVVRRENLSLTRTVGKLSSSGR